MAPGALLLRLTAGQHAAHACPGHQQLGDRCCLETSDVIRLHSKHGGCEQKARIRSPAGGGGFGVGHRGGKAGAAALPADRGGGGGAAATAAVAARLPLRG